MRLVTFGTPNTNRVNVWSMKTKELIAQLQECDPSGEEEVSVGNHDIHFVEREPAYYDGCLQVLKRNERTDCYNVVGAEIRGQGQKIVIHTLSIRWAILNDNKLPVTFDGEYAQKHYTDRVAEWRKEATDIDAEIAAEKRRKKPR